MLLLLRTSTGRTDRGRQRQPGRLTGRRGRTRHRARFRCLGEGLLQRGEGLVGGDAAPGCGGREGGTLSRNGGRRSGSGGGGAQSGGRHGGGVTESSRRRVEELGPFPLNAISNILHLLASDFNAPSLPLFSPSSKAIGLSSRRVRSPIRCGLGRSGGVRIGGNAESRRESWGVGLVGPRWGWPGEG